MLLFNGTVGVNLLKQAKQLYAVRAAWLGEGGQPSPNAQRRADICAQCPYNVERPFEELYKGVTGRVVRMQLELRGKLGLQVEGEHKLHICAKCDCLLRLKVHVPLHIARENTPDWQQLMPSFCWIRTEPTSNEQSPSLHS